jgi:MbtH protein
MNPRQDTDPLFVVVINDEEQHSIWPQDAPLPRGWRSLDARGSRADCLAFIKDAWKDMRPKSSRESR